jgi:hypothetical protein
MCVHVFASRVFVCVYDDCARKTCSHAKFLDGEVGFECCSCVWIRSFPRRGMHMFWLVREGCALWCFVVHLRACLR